ncbi:MAG: MiaB/RimO family radical SAM methylthiotransferase [Anaerolineales bacterium]|nr:MiaB/RimO family radical SAM methylthiotransferase [Anaerolineales bacterium]
MKIFFDLVGCRVNEAEIESMAARARAQGHNPACALKDADWIVINTCTVTREAERDSRQKIRRAHSCNPAARIAVTGCWATMEPAQAASLPGVARVIPNAEKELLPASLWPDEADGNRQNPRLPPPFFRRRTRAYIKVQDGCDNACAYCVTRLARGPLRSRPADAVAADVLAAERAGAQEAVLAGVHLGAWGRDSQVENGLAHLLETVLARTSIPRLRLSSLEPWNLPPGFFRLWGDGRLCPHLHLPLQSGCAATLRRMRRNASPADFERIVEAARASIPDLAVTTDLMVGFPGESESEFRESLEFAERMQFARTHIFRFSPRPGTEAAEMADAVHPLEIRRRALRARRAVNPPEEAYARSFLGREMDVLWEADTRGGMRRGLTGNFLRVRIKSDSIPPNTFSRVRLVSLDHGDVLGEPRI